MKRIMWHLLIKLVIMHNITPILSNMNNKELISQFLNINIHELMFKPSIPSSVIFKDLEKEGDWRASGLVGSDKNLQA